MMLSIISFSVISCKKENVTTPAPVTKTCYVTSTTGENVATYTYDANNRYISGRFTDMDGEYITTNTYGTDGKLSEMYLDDPDGSKEKYRIVHLTNKDQYFFSTRDAGESTFSSENTRYDAEFTNNKVTKFSTFKKDPSANNFTLQSYYVLTYTGENVTQVMYYDDKASLEYTVILTFDDKKNAYKGLFDADNFDSYFLFVSNNNVKTGDFGTFGKFDATYEYNNEGYPTKLIQDGKTTLVNYNCK
ncbi:MAG: hypothetical protein SGJ04_08840 [Bacteroidota bacterium]|nr:hypothetical protein [Bacteroidota bacterium]